MSDIFRPFWISFLCSALLAYPTYLLLLRIKSRQIVSEFVPEHQQKQGTPTMGGLMFLPGILVVLATTSRGWHAAALVAGFALIGFLDDYLVPRLMPGKRGLGWMPKIVMQFSIAAGICYWDIAPMNNDGALAGFGTAIFFVLLYANAFNFADGMDGLSSGILLALAPALIVLTPSNFSGAVPIAAIGALVGGIIPFLLMNAPPAKVFMGDVGALPIGALIGFLLVPCFFEARETASSIWVVISVFALASLVLLLEIVPVPLQILSVKLRKKRLFHRTPIHHWFQDKGWPETRVVALFVVAQLVCSAAAITLSSTYDPRFKVIDNLSTGVARP